MPLGSAGLSLLRALVWTEGLDGVFKLALVLLLLLGVAEVPVVLTNVLASMDVPALDRALDQAFSR